MADDEEAIRDLLQIILQKAGYAVHLEANGNFIYEQAGNYPDLYLLDWQMQDTDGLEACRYLKSSPLTRAIPVIMLSANPAVKTLYREAKADSCIEKPFDIPDLLTQIESLLNNPVTTP